MAECTDTAFNNSNSSNQSVVNDKNDSKEENQINRAMEPLLVEDMKDQKIPRSFQTLLNFTFDNNILLERADYLVLLIHILTLEVGYVPVGSVEYYEDKCCDFNYKRVLRVVSNIPSSWKQNGCYKLEYILPPYVNHMLQMIFLICGEDMVVNCTVQKLREANSSLLLDPALYVVESTSDIRNKFQNMRHLSRMVKNDVGHYTKHIILTENTMVGISLQDLPTEIVYYITTFFNKKDLAMFERTSTFFKMVANDDFLWKQVKGSSTEASFSNYKHAENLKREWARLATLLPRRRIYL